MEFNEKLTQLRKQKDLTQEQLAEKLYVSRTAISKWESGRGYPSIDSLKTIAAFFSVTVDELLSAEEIITIAKENNEDTKRHYRDVVFGLLDICALLLLFLPLFAERTDFGVFAVSLLSLDAVSTWIKGVYIVLTSCTAVFGLAVLVFQNASKGFFINSKYFISFSLNLTVLILFILSSQVYASVYVLVFLAVKAFLMLKCR